MIDHVKAVDGLRDRLLVGEVALDPLHRLVGKQLAAAESAHAMA